MTEFVSIPYPPIEKLGLIGDRRTAALVASDGTLCWMGLPNYDGPPVFGSLLDSAKGGSWKLGPKARRFGRQSYASGGPILQTIWNEADYSLELLDFMPWPQDCRTKPDEDRRVVVRRLRCSRGVAPCRMELRPRPNFERALRIVDNALHSAVFDGPLALGFWSSKPFGNGADRLEADFTLRAGEEVWCAFGPGEGDAEWLPPAAARALRDTTDYWDDRIGAIDFQGVRHAEILRSAMLVHLLTFAPTGALVASPTTSLPERIGGDRNYDYRYTWVRDASLGLGLLAKLGRTKDAKRFLDWLAGLECSSGRPLQVLYTIYGGREAPLVDEAGLMGYRRSRPVRTGNAAVSMVEIDSYGYLTDCILTYLRHGGEWAPEYWALIERIAAFTVQHWREPGSSIWELRPKRNFVASKVMSAATLDRAVQIAKETGHTGDFIAEWSRTRNEIFAEVMSRGWSECRGAFRQHYESDKLDASALLIPLMGLLPVRHPRVTSTIERLVDQLDVNGFLHRFVDNESVDGVAQTVGDEEGAFFMCSFWLAQVLARRDEVPRAEAILRQSENIAGELRLFSEAVDARNGTFLGNTPLVFSQVEYARAALALGEAHKRAALQRAAAAHEYSETD